MIQRAHGEHARLRMEPATVGPLRAFAAWEPGT